MTSRPYMRSLPTLSKALLTALLLPSCSTVNDYFFPPERKDGPNAVVEKEKQQKIVSSQLEWAIQNYEAGDYEKAVPQFRRLAAMGADLPGYELVPFYLGMSLYHKQEYREASAQLSDFLRRRTLRSQDQDARIALLSIHERQGEWDQLLGLAAETDQLTLFQNNRAFLKLLWARALREKGEVKGARVVLDDAQQYLDGQAVQGLKGPDSDRDLWGRYYFTRLLLSESDCEALSPRKSGRKTLYAAWVEGSVDCYRRMVDDLSRELLKKESTWTTPALQNLEASVVAFVEQIRGYLKNEKSLNEKRALQDDSRQHLYRLLGKIDESMKDFKIQGLNDRALESLRKRIDLLIVSLSGAS